ncbi:hypothetical protein ACM66B_001153 [Microbotryomycetes sp. NB124-2]
MSKQLRPLLPRPTTSPTLAIFKRRARAHSQHDDNRPDQGAVVDTGTDDAIHVTAELINAPNELERSRVQLAAALIDYDATELQDDDDDARGGSGPSVQAQRSAILAPYRHLLYERDASAGTAWAQQDDESQPQPQFGLEPVAPVSSYPSPILRSSFDAASLLQQQPDDAPEEEERLRDEWGLNEFKYDTSDIHATATAADAKTRPPTNVGPSSTPSDATRGEPSRDSDGQGPTAPPSSNSDNGSSSNGTGTRTRKLRILERRTSDGRLKMDSLLPSLAGVDDKLPSFDGTDPFREDTWSRASMDALRRTSLFGGVSSRMSTYSTANSFSDHRKSIASDRLGALSRNSMLSTTLDRPRTSMSISPRPLSAMSLNVPPPHLIQQNEDDDEERPLSSLSKRDANSPTMTPISFTSRFDPAMMALAKQEIERDRPQFVNKQAGQPPKLVLMPAPLAGTPLSPPPKIRAEGPDIDQDADNDDENGNGAEDEVTIKNERPAGALYGRSLMDVMEERLNLVRGQAKQYVHGADGRRSMMDYGDTPAARRLLARAEGVEGTGGDDEGSVRQWTAGRRHMSVFGPDLIYQREMEQVRALQAAEELERLEQQERDEEERQAKEAVDARKKKSKGKLVKPSRRSVDLKNRETAILVEPAPEEAAVAVELDQGLDDALLPVPAALLVTEQADDDWFPLSRRSSQGSRVDDTPRAVAHRDASSNELKDGTPFSSEDPAIKDARNGIGRLDLNSTTARERKRLRGLHGWNGSQHSDDEDDSDSDEERKPIRPVQDEDDEAEKARANDDEDDVPLALKLAVNGRRVDDEDDVPLGVRASMLSGLRPSSTFGVRAVATEAEDEDDVPLGVAAMAHQQRQSMYSLAYPDDFALYQAQALMMEQQRQQQQMAFHMAMQQAAGHMAYFGSEHAFSAVDGPASLVGGGGNSGNVDAWRRGVQY